MKTRILTGMLIASILFAVGCKKDEEEGLFDNPLVPLMLLNSMDYKFTACGSRTFTQELLSDAAGDARYDSAVQPPSSYSFDDIITTQITQDTAGSRLVMEMELALIPDQITYNKTGLYTNQSEYQWSVVFENGSDEIWLYWGHRVNGSETTTAFTSFVGAVSTGLNVNGNELNCFSAPIVAGNTMTLSCPYSVYTGLSGIDSSWTMRINVHHQNSTGLLQDCL